MINWDFIQTWKKDLIIFLVLLIYLIPLTIMNINYGTGMFQVCTFLIDHRDLYNVKLAVLASSQVFPDNNIIRDLAASQAILESNLLGNPSKLALKYNNAFGITGRGTNGSVMLETKEYIHGRWITTKRAFAKNECLEDSFKTYKAMMEFMPRYSNIKDAQNFNEAARMVQRDGWATDPDYANQLIYIHEKYIEGKF